MSFKIRMEMFVAEQNLRQLRVLWEGTALSQPFIFIFAHTLFLSRWCADSLAVALAAWPGPVDAAEGFRPLWEGWCCPG